jgi:hypothetical protein
MNGCEHLPRTNVLEGAEDYRIVMDLPGVRNEDLDISLENEVLTIKAERSLEVPEGYQSRRSELPEQGHLAPQLQPGPTASTTTEDQRSAGQRHPDPDAAQEREGHAASDPGPVAQAND